MRKLVPLFAAAAVCGLLAASAQAKLTPAEQKWAVPLIKIWEIQNAGLHLVISEASAKDALVAGSNPGNYRLSTTLAALINCKQPKDLIKAAGDPPSPRLIAFRNALDAACVANEKGAHDFAQAVGAVSKNNSKLAGTLLQQGVAQFKLGSAAVTKAYNALIAIGGKSIFVA